MSTLAETPLADVEETAALQTPFRRFLGEFFESKIASVAFAVLCCVIAIALLAPLISPQNPYDLAQVDVMDNNMPPGSKTF
ncbi:MAG: ABC transporter permease, partial [Alphaproteobacteria bacterium]|nr:ABC transporter permease [Alphaproteobacteria bacterium]